MNRRWRLRLGASAVAIVLLIGLLQVAGFEPDVLRSALVCLVCVALAWVTSDVLVDDGPAWRSAPAVAPASPGTDQRLATYRRILENHLQASTPDAHVRDALAGLARRALASRHQVGLGDPAAERWVHPELLAVTTGAPRRLGGAELERCLRHVEEI